ncbi:Putative secreted protein [Paraburkholderia dioscoreae]|uniref:Secreted protein n=2 Tax=Burkholderiaceae TaxID=119060 RepID=A0A5Q4ZNL3_9BURK|nr:Putative secreted protein [Paraburkholderia dioscoreae]
MFAANEMKMLKIAVLTLAISACASANADPTCTVSASGVAFGNYNPLANANADGTGSVSVTCTGSATVTYTIGASTGSGAYLARKLVSGSQTLNYNVYVDNTRTTIWGDGSSGTSLLSGNVVATSGGAAQASTVYGRISSGQATASVGSYSDILTVTVTY